MNKYYIGDIGTEVILDCGCDISLATYTAIAVKKPDDTIAEWVGTAYTIDGDTDYIRYITGVGDLNVIGIYKVQARLTISGWTGRGETATFQVHHVFK